MSSNKAIPGAKGHPNFLSFLDSRFNLLVYFKLNFNQKSLKQTGRCISLTADRVQLK